MAPFYELRQWVKLVARTDSPPHRIRPLTGSLLPRMLFSVPFSRTARLGSPAWNLKILTTHGESINFLIKLATNFVTFIKWSSQMQITMRYGEMRPSKACLAFWGEEAFLILGQAGLSIELCQSSIIKHHHLWLQHRSCYTTCAFREIRPAH